MDTSNTDQPTIERNVWSLLMQIRYLETIGGDERRERADALRREVAEVGRPLPADVYDGLWKKSLQPGNIVR